MGKNLFFKRLVPFLPLLAVYVIVILLFSSNELMADEIRHMRYAINLTQGFYTDPVNPEIGNGPGYPLVISFLVFFNAPYITIKLLNALFLLISVLFFHKTIAVYLKPKQAIIVAYLFGLYPPTLKWMVYMHSEVFAVFLVCGFYYFFTKLIEEQSKRYLNITLSASFLGVLLLTKVIFAYVVIVMAIFYLILYFFKKSKNIKYGLLVLAGGFIYCIPYLGYTYILTGKTFYWGTQGGDILYWRTSPYPNEFGDWVSKDLVLDNAENLDYYDVSEMKKNHRAFIESLEPYSNVQRDSLYKVKAFENIKEYPLAYIKNTGISALRLFFNYPHSYTPQKPSTYFYIIPNMFLLVFLLSAIYWAIRNPRAVPFELRFIGLFALIFMGGLTLLDGRVRHLIPIIPLLLFFIVFAFKDLIRFQNTEAKNQNKFKRRQSISKNCASDNL